MLCILYAMLYLSFLKPIAIFVLICCDVISYVPFAVVCESFLYVSFEFIFFYAFLLG
jgi:hypothetical protein